MTHQYSRAERLLTRPFSTTPLKRPASPTPLSNGHLHSNKGKGREYDASQLMLSMPRLPMGPAGMIELPEELQDRVSRLVDMSVACRYLAALCQVGVFLVLGRPFSLFYS
jgi:anaphase-promoting complex subunit 6